MNLNHATALITGGALRIGAACAQALALQGVAVVIHYKTSHHAAQTLQKTIQAQGGQAHILQAELTDCDQVRSLLPRAEACLGSKPVNILINNAALFLPGTLRDDSLEQWHRHLAINLTAPFLLMQTFARRLPPGSQGKIIQLIDQHKEQPKVGYAAYSASKSALWTLTCQAALELAPDIQVNAIGPGPILPAPNGSLAAFDQIAAATPLQRPGTLNDITAALIFLLQNDFITGEMIRVDGGEHLC